MHNPTTMKLTPRISEQTFAQSSALNTFVFMVPLEANKQQVKAAVEAQYKVTVTGIRTSILSGKAVRSARRNRQPVDGRRRDVKKAYVTLKDGDKINIFEDVA